MKTMKRNMYMNATGLVLVGFFTGILFAQTDTTEVKRENTRIVIIKKTHDSIEDARDTIEMHWRNGEENYVPQPQAILSEGSFNFGFAALSKPGNSNTLASMPELKTGKSFHIGVEQGWGFNLVAHKLRLWTGVRYDILNFRFSNPDTRLKGEQNNFGYTIDSAANSVKSKLVVNYIGVPVAIGYQSNKHSIGKGFSIKAGVNAGYRVRTHTKVKTENGNKDKVFDDFNANNFAITPFVYVGYNSVGLYARMTTTPFFNENEGADIQCFQFGLVLQ
ncbi:MAG: outer membrane beta-barrel protein [Bacteroidia bacterium]|nr:outer membrane beta-barrel protein [Bacteroidia bacterium]